MKKLTFFTFLLIIVIGVGSCSKSPALYLVGDSTMANKPLEDNPERGWGQLLPENFSSELIIENHAMNGRSTRSFRYEGRWDSVMSKIVKGDYVVIQFGHNDGVETKKGRWCTHEEYRYNLTNFIKDVQQHGGNVILCTPIQRRKFDSTGVLINTHGIYPDIVKEVAQSNDIILVDMQLKSNDYINKLGVEASKDLFLHIQPGIYGRLPEGKIDNTHFSELGAKAMAGLFIEGLKEQNHELVKYLKDAE